METALEAWLNARGLPAPDSLVCVGMAAFIGAFLVLRQARRDGESLELEARTLALTFVAAWLGAALFERAWMIPTRITTGEWPQTVEVDRNFYGGMLGGLGAAFLYLRWRGENVLAYFDRSTWLWGAIVVGSRLGCFLEGCCFGKPTASIVGVRFPPESPVGKWHAAAGWVPPHAWSLPVHPTQLYEVGLGIVATACAWIMRRRGPRPGHVFMTWIATYAIGRLILETFRAHVLASPLPHLSRAQFISVVALLAISYTIVRRRAVFVPYG
jgi:phosphatidylglycerol:prolipoprotein diacylglycerol transferase